MSRIAVMGGGAWGTAIALSLERRGGHAVSLWVHSPVVAAEIQASGENKAFLPGFPVPPRIAITSTVDAALRDVEIVVSVMPSHHVRASYELFAPYLKPDQLLVSATKGLEDGTYLRMSQVIAEVLKGHGIDLRCGVLSGPSFAQEVASGSPTAVIQSLHRL